MSRWVRCCTSYMHATVHSRQGCINDKTILKKGELAAHILAQTRNTDYVLRVNVDSQRLQRPSMPAADNNYSTIIY